MKTKITLFLFLANLFVFTSCNNSSADGPLIGKWTLTADTGTAYGSMSAYYEFRSNGKLYVTLGAEFNEFSPYIKMSEAVTIFDYKYSEDKLVLTNGEVQYQGKTMTKQESYYCEFQVTQLTEHVLDITCTKLESDNIDAFSQQIVIGQKYHLTK